MRRHSQALHRLGQDQFPACVAIAFAQGRDAQFGGSAGAVSAWTRHRAGDAEAAAWRRARRPRPAVLAARPPLRAVVEAKLRLRWSPEQIAHWLPHAYPDDPTMRVSHEAIYL
jgi:hypothetical protein